MKKKKINFLEKHNQSFEPFNIQTQSPSLNEKEIVNHAYIWMQLDLNTAKPSNDNSLYLKLPKTPEQTLFTYCSQRTIINTNDSVARDPLDMSQQHKIAIPYGSVIA